MTAKTIVAPYKPTLKCPPLYKIIFFDDDISTFQCVIDLMVNYFNTNEDDAFRFACKINVEGIATTGSYSKDVAKTKISLAKNKLKTSGSPLRIELFEAT